MTEWPRTWHKPPGPLIHSCGWQTPVGEQCAVQRIAPSTAGVWPTANRAIYVPFVVSRGVTVRKIVAYNGATVSGNQSVGVYDELKNQLTESHTTQTAGVQVYDVADVYLSPGLYYMGMAMDNGTGQPFRTALNTQFCEALGIKTQTTAYPLPSPATFAVPASSYVPAMSILFTVNV